MDVEGSNPSGPTSARWMKIERGIPSEKLQPGKIPNWHVRYSPRFCLQTHTDKQLELLRKEWQRRFRVEARLVVSDMGEVVIMFEQRRGSAK